MHHGLYKSCVFSFSSKGNYPPFLPIYFSVFYKKIHSFLFFDVNSFLQKRTCVSFDLNTPHVIVINEDNIHVQCVHCYTMCGKVVK